MLSYKFAFTAISKSSKKFFPAAAFATRPMTNWNRPSNFSMLAAPAMRSFGLINNDGADIGSEAAAKAAAKDFMNKVEEDLIIDEITTQAEWTTKVMDVKDKPIILDFYAEWCAPCKKLTPVLKKLTKDNDGKFKLVKVNIDNLP